MINMVSLRRTFSVDTLERKPTVIFVPGHLFFAKTVDLPQGMDRIELASFVEISIEEHAPFPVSQVYYGAYLPEGAERALIYAAYRRRFTAGEKELWEDADLVLPDFASLAGLSPEEASLCVLVQEGSVSGLYFDGKSSAPSEVYSRHLDAEGTVEQRREAVSKFVERFTSAYGRIPVGYYRRRGEVSKHKGRVYFSVVETDETGEATDSGAVKQPSVERTVVSAMDVRDKEFLADRNRLAVRNAWLWRSTVSLAVFLGLLLLGEAILYRSQGVLVRMRETLENRADDVAVIQEQLELAQRMEELGRNQLRPFEMLAIVNDLRPSSVTFTVAHTNGSNGLVIDAITGNPDDVNAYVTALRESGAIDRVEVPRNVVSGGESTFRLDLTFNREALQPASEVADLPASRLAARSSGAEGGDGQ